MENSIAILSCLPQFVELEFRDIHAPYSSSCGGLLSRTMPFGYIWVGTIGQNVLIKYEDLFKDDAIQILLHLLP